MLERIAASAGALPDVMTMVAGYWSEDNVNPCAEQGIDAYIATADCRSQPLHRPKPRPFAQRLRCQKPAMARKLQKQEGSRILRQRKAIVEQVNGPDQGCPESCDAFLTQGTGEVNGEVAI